VARRLGKAQPDPDLARILRAWPKLPPTVRTGLVSAVEGFAAR
jgi:hypothetical protein